METTYSSETVVDFQQRYVPEDRTLHSHRYKGLKSYIILTRVKPQEISEYRN
jgi:hypothetical protein